MKKVILAAILCFNILLTGCSQDTENTEDTENPVENFSENYEESTYEKEDIDTLSDLQISLNSLDDLGQVRFAIKNTSDKDYLYSEYYFEIEGMESGKWYQLDQKKDPSQDNEADTTIQSGETNILTLDIEKYYGKLPSGHYRLVKEFAYFEHPKDWDYDEYIISCEFDIQ